VYLKLINIHFLQGGNTMNERKAIDKVMNEWAVSGEETLDNALQETINKWNDIQKTAERTNDTIPLLCGMCKYFNCGECDICIMSNTSLMLCHKAKDVYSLYNEIQKASAVLCERVSEMVYALHTLKDSDIYKNELRYEEMQK